MAGTLVAITAVVGALFTLSLWQPNSDYELCWSCGLRNQHKLWCPNR